MRKHFLLLFLMALLPFAGWAQDPIEVTVTLYDFTIQWGTPEPTVGTLSTDAVKYQASPALTPDQLAEVKGFLTFARVDDGSTNWNSDEVGVYSWTLTKAVSTPGYIIYLSSNNAKLTIEKIPTAWTTNPAVLDDAVDYDGTAKNLLKTLGESNWGTPEYSINGGETWAEGMPTATAVAEYTVKARVVGDAHHAGIAAHDVGISKINGIDILNTEVTAPQGIDGLKYTGEAQALVSPGSVTGNKGTVLYSLDDTNYSDAVPQGTNKGDYRVYWKIKGDPTHNDKAGGSFNVEIDEGTPVITAPTGATGLKYNKTNQALLATNGSVTLGATLTYDVSFNGDPAENKATADLVVGQNAGTYTITPKVAATANTAAVVGTAFEVVIAKKDLYIYVEDKSVVYNGDNFDLATTHIEYNGLEEGDVLTGAVSAKWVVAGDKKDVGEYAVTTEGGSNDNYKINRLESGKVTITARPITLTAKDQAITFGDDAPAFAVSATYIDFQAAGDGVGLAKGTDEEKAYILNAIESVGLATPQTNVGEYDDNIVITKKATAATVAPNYAINVEPGKYTISAAENFTLIAQNKTVTYGESYVLTALCPNGTPAKDVVLEVWNGETKLDENPTDYGTYTIKVKEDPEYVPANFDATKITYVSGTLTINKKELTIAPKSQTLRVGKKASDLVASMVEFTGLVDGDEGKIEYTLAFNTGVAAGQINDTYVDGEGALTVDAVTYGPSYASGIKAELAVASETNRNVNYTLAAASVGNLTVVNADNLVLGTNEAADLADLTTYNGAPVNVKIDFSRRARTLNGKAREWKANTWVTMTLPFDISVADLSTALGYAIVNVIDPSRTKLGANGYEVYGKLTMKGGNGYVDPTDPDNDAKKDTKLAANKPFMVKTADAITGEINFGSQKIIAPANAEALTVDAGKGIKFVGTYESMEVSSANDANIWFLLGNNDNWAYIGSSVDPSITWNIVPFEGYLDMANAADPSAARNMTFYFEELDGSTTAIRSVNVDDLNGKIATEGMYNLNGMKLNTVPTQKGVYILNGKKVVIK